MSFCAYSNVRITNEEYLNASATYITVFSKPFNCALRGGI